MNNSNSLTSARQRDVTSKEAGDNSMAIKPSCGGPETPKSRRQGEAHKVKAKLPESQTHTGGSHSLPTPDNEQIPRETRSYRLNEPRQSGDGAGNKPDNGRTGHLTARAVGQLGDRFRGLDQRVDAYKAERLTNARAHDIVIRAVDCAAITPAQIPDVLLQWRKPTHEEFAARNAFSLWNAFTEVFKTVNPHTALRRGEALHGLFDAETGVALAS
jgi:hypothetical protein